MPASFVETGIIFLSSYDNRVPQLLYLNNNSGLVIVFAELSRRAAFLLLENTVEIAEIVETAIETNLTDRLGSINQHTGSIAQTKVDDILADVTPCMQLEELAESAWTHTSQIGKRRSSI